MGLYLNKFFGCENADVGTIFLNLVKFIVGPIVLFSIMAGVISLSDIRKVGSIGGITIVYYLVTTAVATTLGLVMANLFKGFFPVLSTQDPWLLGTRAGNRGSEGGCPRSHHGGNAPRRQCCRGREDDQPGLSERGGRDL